MLDGQQYQGGEEQEGFSISIGRLVNALRRRWWIILLIVGLVGVVSAAFLSLMPNRYTAVALVQIEPRDKKIAPIDSVIPGLKGDTVTIESEVETLRSRTLLLKVIDKLDLRRDPEYVGPTEWQKLLVSLGLARAPAQDQGTAPVPAGLDDGQPRRDWIVAIVQSNLMVGRVRNTLVMSIEYTSTSPAKAMRIANAIADTYIEAQLEAKQEAQRRATVMLSERVATLAEKLARSEERLTRFMGDNNIYITEGHELLEHQLTREMEETVKAQANVSQVRARYQKVQQMMRDGADVESVSDVLNSHTIRLLRDGLSKSERRLAEAKARLGPKHPTMAQIRADHALARQALKLEVAKIIANMRQERDIAESREKKLAARLAALKEQIKQSKEQQVKLRELMRDVEATRQLYEALLSRSKQTAETAGLQYSDSRILEYAGVPLGAAGPKRKRIFAMILLVALAGAIGGVILVDLLQKGFADPAEVDRVLQHDTIAAFPLWPGGSSVARDVWRGARQVAAQPMSAIAESTRQLRHELDREARHDQPRLIMIASALASEGRSHVATSLAYSYAASRVPTLLVDGDMRFGKLSEALGLAGYPGLLNALAGERNSFDTILSETTTGLSFMPAMAHRRPDLAAPELLAGPRFARLVGELKSEFAVIVIDAPPLLPIVDGRAMATVADEIAFVTTWRRTPKALARRALETLGDDEDKVAGIIVNEIEPSDFKRLFNYRNGFSSVTMETAA
jgi:uncharacterized protein involved in exopolysaccharide biosynthesis/Mrp family chromosome partitioning ATPase